MEYMIVNGELYHHGIKGQKWGVRRYQNEDGTLTEEGIKRYGEHGSDYLKARKNYRTARRSARRAKQLSVITTIAGSKSRGVIGNTIIPGLASFRAEVKKNEAKQLKRQYDKAKFNRELETGRIKKLDGRYQPNADDFSKYGKREAIRIAKRRNKGMTKTKAYRISDNKRIAKSVAYVGVHALVSADLMFNHGRGTKKVLKAGIKGGLKVASIIAKGTRSAKSVYNDYYNTSVLDSSGKVLARYHDTTNFGEAIVSGLLES